MKRRTLLRNSVLALLPFLGLMSCHNDKDEPSVPEIPEMTIASIAGEWLENSSDENMIGLTETCYNTDGTMQVQAVMVNTEINEIFQYEGNWSQDDETLTETYESPFTGGNVTDRYRIMYCDRYSMIAEYQGSTDVAQYDRIVAKHDLSINTTYDFSIEDPEFSPIGYTSTNPHVATVDENGHITACNPGFAYIIATSNIGNAVNKITVTSPLVIDDLIQYMGKNIHDVTSDLGYIYIPQPGEPITFRIFQLPNPFIDELSIGYSSQKVVMVEARFRWNADVNEVMDAWDKAYGTTSTSNYVHSYDIESNGEKYHAMLDNYSFPASLTVIKYTETPPSGENEYKESDFTEFAWLPGTPVIEAAERLNYSITLENIEDGFFDTISISDNNAFENLNVLFEQEEEPFPVTTIFMRCKKNVTEESLKPWLSTVFTSTGEDLNPYTFDVGNGKVYVYFKTVGSRLNVYYSTSKRRK